MLLNRKPQASPSRHKQVPAVLPLPGRQLCTDSPVLQKFQRGREDIVLPEDSSRRGSTWTSGLTWRGRWECLPSALVSTVGYEGGRGRSAQNLSPRVHSYPSTCSKKKPQKEWLGSVLTLRPHNEKMDIIGVMVR